MHETLSTLISQYDFNAPQCVVVRGRVYSRTAVAISRRYQLHVVAARPFFLRTNCNEAAMTLEATFIPFVWLTPARRLVRRDDTERLVQTTLDELLEHVTGENERRWLTIGLRQDTAAMIAEVKNMCEQYVA